jgi:hypothetical protein
MIRSTGRIVGVFATWLQNCEIWQTYGETSLCLDVPSCHSGGRRRNRDRSAREPQFNAMALGVALLGSVDDRQSPVGIFETRRLEHQAAHLAVEVQQ